MDEIVFQSPFGAWRIRSCAPPLDLAPFVDSFWETRGTVGYGYEKLLPTGTAEFMINLGPPQSVLQLTAAGLGFLWELSRRNAYAARLVSGASLNWCEQVAESSPVQLMRFVSQEPHILTLRMATKTSFWCKLLGAGISEEDEVRSAAQLCALQSILTKQPREAYARLPAAACRMPAPASRVAERDRGLPESRD